MSNEELKAYMSVIDKRAYLFRVADDDDIKQMCLIRLWRDMHKYDPSRGAKKSSFAVLLIDTEIKRQLAARKKIYPEYTVCTDNIAAPDTELTDKTDNILWLKEAYLKEHPRANKPLVDYFFYTSQQLSLREIARLFGVSHTCVKNLRLSLQRFILTKNIFRNIVKK